MNELEKIFNTKQTENGDVAYKTTGNNLADLLFLTPFFEKHLDQVNIGQSDREKLLAMYIRDPRYGMGRRDLGRKLMQLSGVSSHDIVKAGRYDDLWHIPTNSNLGLLQLYLADNNVLAKKWMPRLTGKDKKIAKALCKMWNISEEEYRKLIKTDSTVEYKLSYAEKEEGTPLNDLFNKGSYKHPLVDKINFEQVPSMAMHKYLHTFSTREDMKDRFAKYIEDVKENKKKVNTSTANVHDAYKTATKGTNEASDIIAKKTVENATLGVELDAICILDTSASMNWGDNVQEKANSVAHAIATKSTYAPNQIISFSSKPKLMTIKGDTLKEQYQSMYTGDCSNTDFGKVMKLLQKLDKYPEYLIVLSDMEFDCGSNQTKKETMELFKKHGANTRIIWWNFNDRNKTIPEFDEYGNIYLSGYNIQMLKLLENKFDMTAYVDKILEDYKKKIGK
ncbi:MAG: DUF2828 family protein [Bacilli bacterium]|nr:DUF2828 family protein [Bacilli bacterium]